SSVTMSTTCWPIRKRPSPLSDIRSCGRWRCSNPGYRPRVFDRRAANRPTSRTGCIAKARSLWETGARNSVGQHMSRNTPALTDFRRIVVKVGSSLLVDTDGGRIHAEWLASLVADLARLHGEQRDVMVVSSGAIALGRAVLKLPPGALKLE